MSNGFGCRYTCAHVGGCVSRSGIGKVVAGRYRLEKIIGEGGMAKVWKATSVGSEGFAKIVAIKQMKQDFSGMQNYIDMFVEEARVGAELQHNNIVQVVEFLQDDDGNFCLVMEYVDGVDLLGFLKAFRRSGQRLPWGLVAIIGIGVLRGLAAAHERVDSDGKPASIIHRDVSPQNLLLSINGEVKLTDFGLAKAKDRVMIGTDPGMVKGKLSYLAPEVVRGKPVTPKVDIFAVGTVLWESLSGKQLFCGDDDFEVFKKLCEADVPPLGEQRDGLPSSLVAIVHQALALEPDERFASAREFALALSKTLGGAKTAADAQALLARAVKAAQGWLEDPSTTPNHNVAPVDSSEPSWEDVELQFSTISAMPAVDEALDAVDVWFSDANIKLP